MAGYINPLWLDTDRQLQPLNAAGWYDQASQYVDDKLVSEFSKRGIEESDIATDIDGFITNVHLKVIATDFALGTLCASNWGIRDTKGGVDIYADKASFYLGEYMKQVSELSRTMVL